MDALQAIYIAAQGDHWKWTGVHWNFSQPDPNPCLEHWQGIHCDVICDGTVCADGIVEIYLSAMNMVGSLAEEIGDFPSLVNLTIITNPSLTAHIPESIGALSSLALLRVAGNSLTGPIPESIGLLKRLTGFNLAFNDLNGVIPLSLYELSLVSSLLLGGNAALTGPISEKIGALSELRRIDLASNSMSGSIPQSIGNLTKLAWFSLRHNSMNGSIPSEIGQLTALQYLDLNGVGLHGTIPDGFGNLKSLSYLDLSQNELGGHILPSFGKMTALKSLFMDNNRLEGPLSPWLSMLLSLQYFTANSNQFCGSVPSTINQLQGLAYISLASNLLDGTLPDELGLLKQLTDLNLGDNLLGGSFPSWFVNMRALRTVTLSNNGLYGELPEGMHKLINLRNLNLDNNQLAGSLPEDLASVWMAELSLGLNFFTGTFPFALENVPSISILELQGNSMHGDLSFFSPSSTKLEYVNISGNHFTGSLLGLGVLRELSTLDVSFNKLTGSIPSFTNWSLLEYMFVQGNHLSGRIVDMFAAPVATQLTNLDVSFNRLTGPLPILTSLSPPFNHAMQSFSSVSNCFTGTISDAFCSVGNLSSLALDGLSTASSCRRAIIPLVDTYFLPLEAVHGSIPACLFTMPNLAILHLSGNDLDGSIPVVHEIGASLADLSLSHNRLSGTIPTTLQGGDRWSNLDLSFNKLQGSLSGDTSSYNNRSSVKLSLNRLSGNIPDSYYAVSDVNILRGNLFDCDHKSMSNDVPAGDPYKNGYFCASDAVDEALYLWLGLVVAFVSITMFLTWWSRRAKREQSYSTMPLLELNSPAAEDVPVALLVQRVSEWRSMYLGEESMSFHFSDRSCVPLSSLDHIHDTGKLLHDLRVACCWITAFLVCIASPVYIGLSVRYGSYTYQYAWTDSAAFLSGQPAAFCLLLLFILFLGLLCVLVHRMVTTIRSRQRDDEGDDESKLGGDASAVQNDDGLRGKYCILILFNIVVVTIANCCYVYWIGVVDHGYAMILSVLLAIFKLCWVSLMRRWIKRYLQPKIPCTDIIDANNVLFHCLITLFNTIVVPCLATAIADSNCLYYAFTPPPSVSSTYQFSECVVFNSFGCTNSIITNQMNFSYQPPFLYSYQCSSALLLGYAYVFVVKYIIIGLLYPACVLTVSFYVDRRHEQQKKVSSALIALLPPLWGAHRLENFSTDEAKRSKLLRLLEVYFLGAPSPIASRPFCAGDFSVRLAMMVGTLLTFGTVLPYLAVIICFSICSSTYLTQLGLARLLESSAADENMKTTLEDVCRQCKGLFQGLQHTFIHLPVLVLLFYAFFIFDTEGDQEGAWKGFYFMLMMIFIPLVSVGIARVVLKKFSDLRQ